MSGSVTMSIATIRSCTRVKPTTASGLSGEPTTKPAVPLTSAVFLTVRSLFDLRLHRVATYRERDRVMARYAPVSLIVLPGVWVMLVAGAFTGVFWGLGVDPLREAFYLSGSSLFTTSGPPASVSSRTTCVPGGIGSSGRRNWLPAA